MPCGASKLENGKNQSKIISCIFEQQFMSLLQHLQTIIAISPELEQELNSVCKEVHFSKGHILLSEKKRATDLIFINKGIVRGFYYLDGKEITNWFAQEGEFAACFYAFISQTEAFETIEALEDTSATLISYAALQTLYLKFPETERIGRLITENYYIKLEERILSLQFKTAKERYQYLTEYRADLLQRVSLGQIAAYLGITQETLSRIRGGT